RCGAGYVLPGAFISAAGRRRTFSRRNDSGILANARVLITRRGRSSTSQSSYSAADLHYPKAARASCGAGRFQFPALNERGLDSAAAANEGSSSNRGQEHETRAKAGSVSLQPRQSRPRPHHRLHGRAGPRIRDAVPRPGYRTDVSSAAARIFGSGRGFGWRGDCSQALGPDAAGYGSGNHRNRDDGRRPQDRVRSDRPGRARADQHRYARPLRGREGEDLRTAQSKEGKAVRRHDALSTAEPRSRRRGGLAVSAPINGAVLVTRGPMQAYEARDAARGIDGLELVERPIPPPRAAQVLLPF